MMQIMGVQDVMAVRPMRPWGGVFLLIVLPLVGMVAAATMKPDILLLSGSGWMLWHDPERLPDALMLRQDRLRFETMVMEAAPPEDGLLRIRALGEPSVRLNDQRVLPREPRRHWKQPLVYDLRPPWRDGGNCLVIEVSGRQGSAALQLLGPSDWRDPSGWRVRRQEEPAVQAVAPGQQVLPPGVVTQCLSGWWRWPAWLWLLGWTALAVFRVREAGASDRQADTGHRPWSGSPWVVGAVLLLVLGVHAWNVAHLDAWRGPDAQGHIEHIQQVARTWRPALATDGWQAYQPPAYYFVAAGVYRLLGGQAHHDRAIRGVQALGGLCALLLAAVTAALLRRDVRAGGASSRHLGQGVILAAAAPLVVGNAALVNSEMFTALVIGAALLASLRRLAQTVPTTGGAAWVGLGWGVAMLSKFTALVPMSVVGLIGLLQWHRAMPGRPDPPGLAGLRRRSAIASCRRALAAALALLLVCGWFYGRNLWCFGNPFYGNWQAFPGWFPPGIRWPGYYLRFGDFLTHDLDWVMWSSFWDSLYRSLWAGDRGLYVWAWMTQAHLLLLLLMLIAWPLLATMGLGWLMTLRSATRQQGTCAGDFSLALVLLVAWSFLCLIWFSLVVPAWGSCTARYLLYLTPVAALLFVRGRSCWSGRWRYVGRAVDGCLLGMALLTVLLFRFGGWRA